MKITIPIRGSEFEEDFVAYELFLEEIITLSKNEKLISLIDNENISSENEYSRIEKLEFEIKKGNRHDNSEPKFATELNKTHHFFHTEWTNEYLIIKLNINTENTNDLDNLDDLEYLEYLVNEYLTRLNFLINLSYATNVDFLYGVIYSNSNKYIGKTNIIVSTNMYAYEHSRKINWPKIDSVRLIETISWFYKFKIHPNNRSENNLHRAINAFSNLYGGLKKERSADLFWVMLGIESLLVEGNQNITSQFKDKSIIILGKPNEYKRKLTKLYEYRSKLIHGSFNIYPKYYSNYHDFDDEYSEYLDFAVSILIALMRKLIKKQKSQFEFELKLKE